MSRAGEPQQKLPFLQQIREMLRTNNALMDRYISSKKILAKTFQD